MTLILPKLLRASLTLGLLAWIWLTPLAATAQVRTKKPDREVYRGPELQPGEADSPDDSISKLLQTESEVQLSAAPRLRPLAPPQRSLAPDRAPAKWGGPLVDAELGEVHDEFETEPTRRESTAPSNRSATRDSRRHAAAPIRHQQPAVRRQPNIVSPPGRGTQLAPPHRPQTSAHDVRVTNGETWTDEGVVIDESLHSYAPVVDGDFYYEDGCDVYEDGCDSIGLGHRRSNAFLSFEPDRWFGSVELLLMFRSGDRPPPLVTTGPADDADTAGEIGQAGTQILVGNDNIFDDLTAGGRLTLGTWLDSDQNRKLMLRGWVAGEESFSFFRNQDQIDVLARPFNNVTDGQTATQDTQLVIFPDRASGSLSITGNSDVFGADLSVHQFYHGQYGLVTDLLYGYQFMQVEENLAIGSTSTSLSEDFAPVGSVISVFDSFDVENEFHGGQIGIASSYREGCWSFRSLMKVGFGSLRRTANLRGQTTTEVDGAVAVDANGLLVRGTNRGEHTDHTFGWAPELDFTFGWQRYPHLDLTFGYHIMALTDALQVSGAIDRSLSVNLADPPTGEQRPTASLRYGTFYVQGIHFGVHYLY